MTPTSHLQVSLCRCTDYQAQRVEGALRALLAPLGGMERFVRPGQRVLLKPNLLSPTPPERASTTHPVLVEAVVRLVQQAGGRALIADSAPASIPYTPAGLARLYRATGMVAVAERTGADLYTEAGVADLPCPEGVRVRRFEVLGALARVDLVISLPKLKTHALTVLTGAVKNLFGVIPGVRKATYHVTHGRLDDLCDLFLDLSALVSPALVVMDAVMGMDGDGPSGGRPLPIGLLLASTSGVALDAVASALAGIPAHEVPTLRRAADRGLWSGEVADIDVLGLPLEEAQVAGFRRPQANPPLVDRIAPFGLGPHIRRLALRYAARRPVPQAGRCTACGTCELACPMQAITVEDGLAWVDEHTCIRCYCCHEVCPERAIDLETPWLARLMTRIRG